MTTVEVEDDQMVKQHSSVMYGNILLHSSIQGNLARQWIFTVDKGNA